MKRLVLILTLFITAIIFFSGEGTAGDYVDGYTEDGYVYHAGDGYWWRGTDRYTRTRIARSTAGYYSCGVYYPGQQYYHWQYNIVPVITSYAATPPVPTYSKDWKVEVLKYAEYRDDQQAFLNALNSLGIQGQQYQFQQGGNYRNPLAMPYVGSGTGSSAVGYNTTYGTYGAGTQYGYSYKDVAAMYGATDLNLLYQQVARLTQNTQTLAGQAHLDFTDLVGREGDNRARVLETLARGQAARNILDGISAPQQSSYRTFSFRIDNGQVVPGDDPTQQEVQNPKGTLKQWQQSAGQCVDCHSGGVLKGGFDVTKYTVLAPELKKRVIERLETSDPAKHMPRTKAGGAGKQLTTEEVQLWKQN